MQHLRLQQLFMLVTYPFIHNKMQLNNFSQEQEMLKISSWESIMTEIHVDFVLLCKFYYY